jgi:light-regulated signal transduction histidine kinase (bacteriophytochrome)
MNEVIAEVQSDLADLIERNDAAVQYARLPVIAGQRVMLRLLLQNLVSNAVKFHRPDAPPRIQVSVAEEPTHWVLAVSDNGIGIKEQYFGRIFDIFRRLHSGREYAGTGIGLALCRKIAEMHGGAITVQSQPGAGSTFRVTLLKA